MQRFGTFILPLFVLALLAFGTALPDDVLAQSLDEIKSKIDEQSEKIKRIEAEIAAYEKQLGVIGAQKQTLQSAISSLDVSRQQTGAQINLTENKISTTNLKLGELAYEIKDTEGLITLDKKAIAQSLRSMAETSDASMIEQMFGAENLTEAWIAIDDAAALNNALRSSVANLSSAKQELTVQHQDVEIKKKDLTTLRNDLANQKKSLDIAKAEKDRLLAQTKNQESTYQSLIATKRAEQKSFETELTALANSLKSIGQGAAPSAATGVLAWPYSSAFAESCKGKAGALGNPFCITQYFGNTPFATANAQVYNGGGHNAIDIGMPSGTPVLAALSGTVLGTGNTDAVPGCYSFGKWVMVKHANGLATLYSHLSSINVSSGQSVTTGQAVGYSGMTGYATGPHLHFGVYASAGVQIMSLGQFRNTGGSGCTNAVMPVAPKDAYLNPMSYL